MIRNIQTNFTSGELDPLLAGRVDVKYYYNGVERLRNMLPLPQGGVRRRPGLEFIDEQMRQITRVTAGVTATAPNGGTAANAIDDSTSTEVVTTANISTTNPYVVVHYDLGSAKTILLADIVGAKLSAGSSNSTEWFIQYSTDNIVFTSLGNAVPMSITDTSRRVTGPVVGRYWRFVRIGATDMGTAKAQVDEFTLWQESATLSEARLPPFEFSTTEHYMLHFTDRNVGVYRAGVWQADVRTPYTSAQLAAISWTQSLDTMIIFHEDVATQKLVRQGDHDEWQMSAIAWDFIPVHAFTEVISAPAQTLTPSSKTGSITLTAGGGTVFSAASVNQYVEGNGGRARIVQYTSATVVKAIVVIDFLDANAIASGAWTLIEGYEAVWSSSRGYPRCGVFHEGRLYVGGSKSRPSTVWGSRVGQFYNFDTGQLLDDEGIDYTIGSDDVPAICNLNSGRHLQIFTTSSEFFVPQTLGEPLTPENFTIRRTSTNRGSKVGIKVAEISGAVLFLQKEGKSVREFIFADSEQNYNAGNISLLSSHLLSDPVDMALRKSTNTDDADVVFLVNDDGTLAALTTLREQEVTAWSGCDTEGLFKAVGVDQTTEYFSVERDINGTARRYLERFNSELLVDSGVLYSTLTPLTSLSGLSHLTGESANVIADDAVLNDETVVAGAVTPDRSVAATAQVGLPFNTQIKPMPLVVQLQDGTNMHRKKRVMEIMMELFETSDILVDGERPAFRTFGEAGAGSPLDTTIAPFTGRKIIECRLGWDEKSQPDFTQNTPAKLTLLAIEMQVQL